MPLLKHHLVGDDCARSLKMMLRQKKMLQQSCFAQASVDPGLDLAQGSRQYRRHDGVSRLVLNIFKGFVAELHPCV